jgi:O-antigen ligase
VWKEHPILGAGGGEYKAVMSSFHYKTNPDTKNLLPHNQFIRTGMAYGWIGLILLLSGFGIILARRETWTNFPLLLITGLLFVSLLVESNLDRYYALAFFMLFLGINNKLFKE